ncbi:MAG: transcriptional repressor [Candidatus Eisenbacteria sp.]|nr:transcriptional repressor [Candidatus Eisenbacteria bacterium]
MDRQEIIELLNLRGIQPSAQRVAIAQLVLGTDEHPTAEQVWQKASESLPVVSRATVYNTLNLLTENGLLRRHALKGVSSVFDGNPEAHHHFVDEETGELRDIPWDALEVSGLETLPDSEITGYMVVVRGRRRNPTTDKIAQRSRKEGAT